MSDTNIKGGIEKALAQTTYESILMEPACRLTVLAIPHEKPEKTTKAKPKMVVVESVCSAMIPKPVI